MLLCHSAWLPASSSRMANALCVGFCPKVTIFAMLEWVPSRSQPGGGKLPAFSNSRSEGDCMRMTGGEPVTIFETIKLATAYTPTVEGGPADEMTTNKRDAFARATTVSRRCVKGESANEPFHPGLSPSIRKFRRAI